MELLEKLENENHFHVHLYRFKRKIHYKPRFVSLEHCSSEQLRSSRLTPKNTDTRNGCGMNAQQRSILGNWNHNFFPTRKDLKSQSPNTATHPKNYTIPQGWTCQPSAQPHGLFGFIFALGMLRQLRRKLEAAARGLSWEPNKHRIPNKKTVEPI